MRPKSPTSPGLIARLPSKMRFRRTRGSGAAPARASRDLDQPGVAARIDRRLSAVNDMTAPVAELVRLARREHARCRRRAVAALGAPCRATVTKPPMCAPDVVERLAPSTISSGPRGARPSITVGGIVPFDVVHPARTRLVAIDLDAVVGASRDGEDARVSAELAQRRLRRRLGREGLVVPGLAVERRRVEQVAEARGERERGDRHEDRDVGRGEGRARRPARRGLERHAQPARQRRRCDAYERGARRSSARLPARPPSRLRASDPHAAERPRSEDDDRKTTTAPIPIILASNAKPVSRVELARPADRRQRRDEVRDQHRQHRRRRRDRQRAQRRVRQALARVMPKRAQRRVVARLVARRRRSACATITKRRKRAERP